PVDVLGLSNLPRGRSGYVGDPLYYTDVIRVEPVGETIHVVISAHGLPDLRDPATSCIVDLNSGAVQNATAFVSTTPAPGGFDGYLVFPNSVVKADGEYVFVYSCLLDHSKVPLKAPDVTGFPDVTEAGCSYTGNFSADNLWITVRLFRTCAGSLRGGDGERMKANVLWSSI